MDVLGTISPLLALTGLTSWKFVAVAAAVGSWAWSALLDVRQLRRLLRHAGSSTLPQRTLEAFDPLPPSPEEIVAARNYSIDKLYFSLVTGLIGLAQTIALIVFDMLPLFWHLSQKTVATVGFSPDAEIATSIVFSGMLVLFSTVVSLPSNYYFQFVVEQRHGFNKQTPALFFSDMATVLVLTGVFGAPILAALVWIFRRAGPYVLVYTWLLLAGFQLFFMTIYPSVIQPLFNKFSALEDAELKGKIDALAERLKFPLKKIFVVDGSKRSAHSNAYMYGLFNNKRIVIYDTLLQKTTHEEVVGVLAHELGHWKLRHILYRLAFIQLYLVVIIYMFSCVVDYADMYEAFGFASRPIVVGFMLFQMLDVPVEMAFQIPLNFMSRAHEFDADAFGVAQGHAENLRTALIKISTDSRGNLDPDWLYSFWHYSHPPIVERLLTLKKISKKKK